MFEYCLNAVGIVTHAVKDFLFSFVLRALPRKFKVENGIPFSSVIYYFSYTE